MELSQAEQYFQKYYDELMRQVINARAHLKLWERLESYKSNYLKELNQAPHFFQFTMQAHLDDALLTLSRILDKHEDSLSIWKFLDFVEQNCKIFSTQAFHWRMKHKPDYDEHRVKSHTSITLKEIQEHRQKLESLKETIDNLKEWRVTMLAHTDRQFYLKGKIISEEYPLQHQQLEKVTDTIVDILNRYSYAYNSSTWLEKNPGEDDVQYVMDAIRFKIQERKKQVEALRKQVHNKE